MMRIGDRGLGWGLGIGDWGLGVGKWVGVVALILLLMGCQGAIAPSGQMVRVSRVVSGQTIEVLANGQPQAEQVRLIGIDAPRLEQEPWGVAAKARLQALVNGKTIALETEFAPQDGFGRKLAYVWLDGHLLNEQLVEEGLALAMGRSPNLKYDQRLANAQEKARLLGLGIWNPDHPLRELSPS